MKRDRRPARGLGKGLAALIPGSELPASAGLVEIPVGLIDPNPYQPRSVMEPGRLQELAESIRRHGILQPLVVSRAGDRYQLIAGERRWLAARQAGLERVPAVVKEASPSQMLQLALVENLQRADLNPLEAAGAYQQLNQEFGLTHEEIARLVGKHRVTVTNSLRLLRLPQVVKEAVLAGQLSEGHARALLPLEREEEVRLALRRIREGELSMRQTEELVRRIKAGRSRRRGGRPASPETQALERRFQEALGTRVALYRSRRGGRLVIHFYSEEELEALAERLLDGASG